MEWLLLPPLFVVLLGLLWRAARTMARTQVDYHTIAHLEAELKPWELYDPYAEWADAEQRRMVAQRTHHYFTAAELRHLEWINQTVRDSWKQAHFTHRESSHD